MQIAQESAAQSVFFAPLLRPDSSNWGVLLLCRSKRNCTKLQGSGRSLERAREHQASPKRAYLLGEEEAGQYRRSIRPVGAPKLQNQMNITR